MKTLHKWPSLVIAIFILLWALSGIILNHRYTFSSFDVDRKFLPAEHHYWNWNNAAIRGSVRIDSNTVIFYGNVGAWKYDENSSMWNGMNAGFPAGADHYKINCLFNTDNWQLFAGTRFGLHRFDRIGAAWKKIEIPHNDQHVVDIMEMHDTLWVMTRSHLWKFAPDGEAVFRHIPIPAPLGYDNKVGLFKTLWVIHSGEIYGQAGKLLVDAVAGIFIFLTISGLVYFFFPRWMKKRKKRSMDNKKLALYSRWSIKWHNKIGIWLALILIMTTFTGMFLRPPLLIAIASGRVGKIPYSVLDDGNPWHDQLRRILYDSVRDRIILATSEGMFQVDTYVKEAPQYINPQPPVSVMGYNVFALQKNDKLLVGSFTGIFTWDTERGLVLDKITGLPYDWRQAPSSPVSENLISGYHVDGNGNEYIFDYNKGVLPGHPAGIFPAMPGHISQSRMPLWNVALEMHTARLLKPLLGDFYILFIPLFGLCTVLILISGVILWIRKFTRPRK